MHCERCKYDLSGIVEHDGLLTCPECGLLNDRTPPQDLRPPGYIESRTMLIAVLPVGAMLAFYGFRTDTFVRLVVIIFALPIGCVVGVLLALASTRLRQRSPTSVPHKVGCAVFIFLLLLNFVVALAGVVILSFIRPHTGSLGLL